MHYKAIVFLITDINKDACKTALHYNTFPPTSELKKHF